MSVFSNIVDLLKKTALPNTYTVLVSEYAYGLIETKYTTTNNIEECISIIKNRYKYFQKERKGYKHIEEEYFKEGNCLRITTHFDDNKHTFATNIQIIGINTKQYKKIKKILIKIFGDCILFDI
jgi:hypothetical protein